VLSVVTVRGLPVPPGLPLKAGALVPNWSSTMPQIPAAAGSELSTSGR
jgi:hypothetical protein